MKHILIDFENTQPDAAQLHALNPDDSHIWLFLGKNQQKTLPIELCEALCRFGQYVHFIRIAKTGKNALDFYLTYYLGQITAQDKDALICILSRDTGFDILVEHLESTQLCRGIIRLAALEDAAHLPGTTSTVGHTAGTGTPSAASETPPGAATLAPQDEAARILDVCKKVQAHLMHADYRPRQRQNLETRLAKHLRDTLQPYDEDTARTLISQAVDRLIRKTLISVGADGLLAYHLGERELQQLRCTDNHKIQYPPYPADNGQLQQQAAQFLSKFSRNKPAKRSSLATAIRHMLKTDDTQTETLIRTLVAQNKLCINDNGSLAWLA